MGKVPETRVQRRLALDALAAVAHQFSRPLPQRHVVGHQQALAPGQRGLAGGLDGPIRWRSKRTRWPASITRPSAALAALRTHLYRAFVHRQHCLCALASDAEGGTQRAHQALFGAHQERPRRLAPIRRGAEVDLSAIQAQQALAGVVAHVQRAVGVHLELAAVPSTRSRRSPTAVR